MTDLLSEARYKSLLANPGLSADELRALALGTWVIVDKVQRLPDLLNEVHPEALLRNLPELARFLPLPAFFHGQILNVTNIARDAGVARATVAGYPEVPEETLLCFRVPAYVAKLRVRERKLPKGYWCDPGIVRAMKRAMPTDPVERRGALFEGLAAQWLRAYKNDPHLFEEMYSWAPSAKSETEVDFLLLRGSDWIAAEAKFGKYLRGEQG